MVAGAQRNMGTQENCRVQQYLKPHPLLWYHIRIEHLYSHAGHLHVGVIKHDPEQRSSHLHNRVDAKKTSNNHGSRLEVQREYHKLAGISMVQIR